MAEHNEVGNWGEDMAAEYLVKKGYYIRERDWKCGKRDLDIVAVNDQQNILVVAEVKTRSAGDTSDPLLAVDSKKIRNLGIAAYNYVTTFALDYEVRFDIIAITGSSKADARIDHIEDAFNPLLL